MKSKILPNRVALVFSTWLLSLGLIAAASGEESTKKVLGFSAGSIDHQLALEARFDAAIRTENLHDWMGVLAAKPHHVGSPWGLQNAEWMAGLFKSWGYEVEIERYDVLFPTPVLRHVELIQPVSFVAALTEPALAEDSSSGQEGQLPSYNAYSIDGDVTGELVYVNQGIPADYEELERRGIDVRGKIVIARYGGSWRGIKPKLAAEKGAIGCLLYSDPRDDGFSQGDAYPQGGYRPSEGVQRGSVADMPLFPGDPLTPFDGSVEGAFRIAIEDAPTLTRVPVLPLSWSDAQPLLAALGGRWHLLLGGVVCLLPIIWDLGQPSFI